MIARKITVDKLIDEYHELNPRARLTLFGSCSGISRITGYKECQNPNQCPCRWDGRWRVEIRHARIDKRGRSYSYGTRYCAFTMAMLYDNYEPVPFSDSEMRSLYRLLELLHAIGKYWCTPVTPRFYNRGYRMATLKTM